MDSDASPAVHATANDASVLAPVRPIFRAVARTVVPELDSIGATDWAEIEEIIESSLARRPPAMRRQLRIFLRLINWFPVFRWGRTFRGLDPRRRARFLDGLQRSRIFLFRRGFWSVRTLTYMGHYSRESAYGAIGYRAGLRGWLEHPDAPEGAREATRAALDASGGES